MIDGQVGGFLAAVLAGVMVAAENFSAAECDLQTRAVDHMRQADHGGQGKNIVGRMNISPAIEYQRGFLGQHESHRALIAADIDGLKIGVENEHRLIHRSMAMIIARRLSRQANARSHEGKQT